MAVSNLTSFTNNLAEENILLREALGKLKAKELHERGVQARVAVVVLAGKVKYLVTHKDTDDICEESIFEQLNLKPQPPKAPC